MKKLVLGIIDNPISIENIEKNIVERAFKEGWIAPASQNKNWKKHCRYWFWARGLAAAQQLNRAGHAVTVFERTMKSVVC